jgi:hypothetical protein
MPLRGPYAPAFPQFDSFLFADVGEEVDGAPLSVLSALSRLGLDPRGEAARLSHLASEAATDQLARALARLPGERWDSSEVRRIAAGLVDRLPSATKSAANDEVTSSADHNIGSRSSRPWIYLALLFAVLVGAIAHGMMSPPSSSETPQPASAANPRTPPG